MAKKTENFHNICKNIIFNFVSEYAKEKQSVKNNAERTDDLANKYANKLKRDFDETDGKSHRYAEIIFFPIVLMSCYEYFEKYFDEKMLNTNDESSILLLKYKNALHSLRTISCIMQSNDFHSCLILFRAIYENLVIIKFLLKNSDCIGDFDEYSMIKLSKLYNIDGKKLSIMKTVKINSDTDKETYRITNLDIENELKKYYNWAKKKIRKDRGDINFHDIDNAVFENEKGIKEMMEKKYALISDLIHANTSILVHPDKEEDLFRVLIDCFYQMGFALMVDVFIMLFKYIYKGQFSSEVDTFNHLFFILFPDIYGK